MKSLHHLEWGNHVLQSQVNLEENWHGGDCNFNLGSEDTCV